MKKLILKNMVICLAMIQASTANAGKESGNALLLPDGSTAYRSQLCIEEQPLSDFIKKQVFEAQFSELKETAGRFHPGLAQQTANGIRVCVTSRPIGSLLGLGDSDLRVAGYIARYRGDQKIFSGQAPYIFISKKYLDSKPAAANLAEITFAETLHSVMDAVGYSVDNLRLEKAMTTIIAFKSKELNSENLIKFDDQIKDIGFPGLADIPMGLTDIKTVNAYIKLSHGRVNIDIPSNGTHIRSPGFENVGYVYSFNNEENKAHINEFFDLVDQLDLSANLSHPATAYLIDWFVLFSSIGKNGEMDKFYPSFSSSKGTSDWYDKDLAMARLVTDRLKNNATKQHFVFAKTYFTEQTGITLGDTGNYMDTHLNGVSLWPLVNLQYLIENDIISNKQPATVPGLLTGHQAPISRILLAAAMINSMSAEGVLGKNPEWIEVARWLMKSKYAPGYNVFSIDGSGLKKLGREVGLRGL